MAYERFIKPYYQQLLFVILAFLTMVGVSFWYVKDIVQQQTELTGDAAIDSANATVRSLISETEISLINVVFTIEDMISRGESQEAIKEHMSTLSGWYAAKAQRYFAFNGIYGYIRGEYLDGTGWSPPPDYEPLQRPWYIGAVLGRGDIHYTEPYVDAQTGKIIISVSQEVFNRRRSVCGVVAVDFDITAVSEHIRKLHPVGGGYSFLLNERLELVSHKEPALQGRSFPLVGAGYARLAEILGTADRLSAIEVDDYDGTPSVVFMSRLFNGWYLGTVTPVGVYYGKVRTMAIVLSCLGAALMSILCVLLVRLYNAKAAADEKSQSKSFFLARMSHEIRTPMNAIMGMSELILRDGDILPDKTREQAKAIRQSSLNLLAIINEILDFSKIESGKLELVPVPYLLSSLLNDVINIIRMRMRGKPVMFTVFIDSSLPNELIGDEVRIRQVLLNILSNAVKYTDQGHIEFAVTGSKRENGSIVLTATVADTGRGIKEEDLEKLFDEFVRMDMNTNRAVEGAGLGLAITRNLVSRMGGEIGVSSAYGVGSRFSVSLPQRFITEHPFARVLNPESKSVLLYGKSLLYVRSLAAALENLGVPFKAVTTLERFVEAAEKERYAFFMVEDSVYKLVEEILERLKRDTRLVIFADIEHMGSVRGERCIVMPGHVLSVANALNDTQEKTFAGSLEHWPPFTAPDARILAVDDIQTNLHVIEGLLHPYGLAIDSCLSGAEALELLRAHRYDLIFMDHMMPGMDGMETAARIRALPGEQFRQTPIVALTANAISGMKDIFLENGMNDFLSKPIDPAKLDFLLRRWLPKEMQIARKPGKGHSGGSGALEGMLVDGVDFGVISYLFSGDLEAYIHVVRSFVTHIPAILEQVRTYAGRDVENYTIAVHGIKGSSASIGANAVAAWARALEIAAADGDDTAIEEGTEAFAQTVEKLILDLSAFLDACEKKTR